jgi:hypothetical protein
MLIGAVKAGSSSVYHYLGQHPDIYMSPLKETKFFQWDGESHRFSTELDQTVYEASITTYDDYLKQFAAVDGERAIGEATPSYLYNRHVPERLHKRFPSTKLILILRHPVDRAYSHFLHTKRLGYEPLTFIEALAEEKNRIAANWGPSWHYASQGYYYEQVKRFVELFGKDNMRLYLFDDLKAEPARVVQDMYSFLGVDPDFEPDTNQRHNKGDLPRNQLMHNLTNKPNLPKTILKALLPTSFRKSINRIVRSKNSHKPELDSALRNSLSADYQKDIRRLEALVGVDLGRWYL